MSDQITFYDLTSQSPGTAWSLNPWKTRFLLNYKGLDYKTVWMTYPEIEPAFKDHVPPNEQGRPYTIPVVQFPDGKYVMESKKIAKVIEGKHPEPSVHLDSPYLQKLEELMSKTLPALIPIIFYEVPRRILTEPSIEYWHRVRSEMVGMPLEEFRKEKGGNAAWDAAEPGLKQVTALLRENADGPFFMGKTLSYADFVWAGFLIFTTRIGDDFHKELLKRSGDAEAHQKLLEGVEPWSKRDDH